MNPLPERMTLTRFDAMVELEAAPPRTVFMLRFNVTGGGEGHIKISRADAVRIVQELFSDLDETANGWRVTVTRFESKGPGENKPRFTYWIG